MLEFLKHLFDTGSFMPHGMCYLWNPAMIRLHFLSDLLIGLSYVVISLTLVYFVYRAKAEIPFSWIFLAFGTFIIACGATHFMEVWTLWTPVYWLSGAVKLITAAASVGVAIVLPPLLPKSLALIRSANLSEQRRAELEAANQALNEYANARGDELAGANQELTRLADIVRDSTDAIESVDLDGRITGWNAAADRLYGYRSEEVLGQPASMLAPPGLQTEKAGLMAGLKRGERVDSLETTRLHKNGGLFYVSLSMSPIKDAQGELRGATMVVRDISERKRAELMFRTAVEAAPNAMIMVDAQGIIILVNAQTEKLFGYTRAELLGRTVDILVPQQFRARHPEHRADFLRHPRTRAMGAGMDLYGLRKDGTEFPIEIGLNPIQTEQGTRVLSAIVDITQRKQAAEEITRLNHDLERHVAERTAELSAVNAELEAFSYSVAHDLRAPLRHISGFSKLLAEECGDQISAESQRFIRRIQEGAQNMGALVDDLLTLASVSRQTLSRKTVALNELVHAVIDDLAPEFAQRNIQWQTDPLWNAQCDPGLMKQVFVNLISNSIKFTRGRDPAMIHIGTVTIDQTRTIFVRDNGAGFDMAYAGKLFGVFQRLHRSADFEGTGVGLANVQRIVHKHGGRIWAEAQLDQGATFFLTLPDLVEHK